MSKKKLIIGLGLVVAAGLIITMNFKGDDGRTVEVNATTVTTTELVEIVSASGRIQPQTKVNITSEVNGEIMKLAVREGQAVKQGQLLIVLDTVRLRSDVDQARFAVSEINARVNGSKTLLEQAEEEFRRQERLHNEKLTSETVFKNARYEYLSAKSSHDAMLAQAQQLNAALDKQLENLRKAKILSPMDGIVTFIDAEEGEIAAAQTSFTQGKTLMTISNTSVFEVEVEVDETEVTKLAFGQPAKIEVDAFPDTSFSGTVTEIGNTAIVLGGGLSSTDASTNFKVKVVFSEAHANVRPGMSATVDITSNTRPNALALPFSAVVVRSFDMDSLEAARLTESSGVNTAHAAETSSADSTVRKPNSERKELKGVFVIRNGVARFTEIETGIADAKNIQVSVGLKEGDSVISGPYSILRTLNDGDKVTVEEGNQGQRENKQS